MARPELKKYEEIRDNISPGRRWFDDFFLGHLIEVESHKWGSVVSYQKSPDDIFMILEGQAEICEEYFVKGSDFKDSFKGARAYRPIRIIERGDVVGDFSVIDEAVGLSGDARPGERWEVAYGARSAIFLAEAKISDEVADRLFMEEESVIASDDYDHKYAYGEHNFLKKSVKTVKIARFRLALLSDDAKLDFLKKLIKETSWKRAYTYRTCPNSYNFGEKLKFQYGCKAILGKYETAGRRLKEKVPNSVFYTDTIEVFLDALYDAINRPVRQEPVFAHCDAITSEYSDTGEFTRCLFPVRVSKREDIEEFYFPIGLLNFQLASYAAIMDQEEIFRKAFLNERAGLNGSVFWNRICNEILNFHRNLPTSIEDVKFWGKKAVRKQKRDELAADWSERFSQCVTRAEESGLVLSAEVLTTALLGKQVFLKYSRKK